MMTVRLPVSTRVSFGRSIARSLDGSDRMFFNYSMCNKRCVKVHVPVYFLPSGPGFKLGQPGYILQLRATYYALARHGGHGSLVYAPNRFSKKLCLAQTMGRWCKGECTKPNPEKGLTNDDCWAFSYRCHLAQTDVIRDEPGRARLGKRYSQGR